MRHNIQLNYNHFSQISSEYLPAGYSAQANNEANIHRTICWIRWTVNEYPPTRRMDQHYIYHNIQWKHNCFSRTSSEYLSAGYSAQADTEANICLTICRIRWTVNEYSLTHRMDQHYIYHNIQLKYNCFSRTSSEYLSAGHSAQADTRANIHQTICRIRRTVNKYSLTHRMDQHYIYHNIQLKYSCFSRTSSEYLPAGYSAQADTRANIHRTICLIMQTVHLKIIWICLRSGIIFIWISVWLDGQVIYPITLTSSTSTGCIRTPFRSL